MTGNFPMMFGMDTFLCFTISVNRHIEGELPLLRQFFVVVQIKCPCSSLKDYGEGQYMERVTSLEKRKQWKGKEKVRKRWPDELGINSQSD